MKQLQHPRGNTAANDVFTGAISQITIDFERNEIRLHDGVTPGGHRILNLEQLRLIFMSKDSEFGNVAFSESDLGFLVRIGDREWTLREFIADDGITIVNPLGTDDDPTIGLDIDFLTNLFLTIASGRLYYAGLTDGDADHFTLPDNEEWDPDLSGAILLCTFHVTANENADLTINGKTRDLRTANGSQRVNEVLLEDTVALLMSSEPESSFYAIGLQSPQETGIQAIDGLDATNVQDALEELAARFGGAGGGIAGYHSYGELTSIPSGLEAGAPIDLTELLPLNGDSFIMIGHFTASGGTGGTGNPVTRFSQGPFGYYMTRLNNEFYVGPLPSTPLNVITPDPLTGETGSLQEGFKYDPSNLYGPPPKLMTLESAPFITITSTDPVQIYFALSSARRSEVRPTPGE